MGASDTANREERARRWESRILHFAQRILVRDRETGAFVRTLKQRAGADVHAIEPDASLSTAEGCYDAVILPSAADKPRGLGAALSAARRLLDPNGFVLFSLTGEAAGDAPASAQAQAARAGLAVYAAWTDPGPADPGDDAARAEHVAMAVRPDYDPLNHARALFRDGHPGWSYEVLSSIPPELRQEPGVDLAVSAEIQLCLLAWAQGAEPQLALELFFNAQALFYHIICAVPHLARPYQCQAEFWRTIGNDDMAARWLRSYLRVYPSEDTARQLARYRPETTAQPPQGDAAPEWTGNRLPRVLMITHPRPHYGLDVLFDGLCGALGDERVTEYPWKPTLHGERPAELAHYPCSFERGGRPITEEGLLEGLRAGDYDLLLFGDIEQHLGQEAARRIVDAAGDTPIFILDQQDDPMDNRRKTLSYLGIQRAAGYFKREMLACHRYGADTYPLPFAYADHRVATPGWGERTQPLFWAGHRQFGLRRLYLERLETLLEMRLDRNYAQEEYTQALRSSRVGLNVFGFGFDTVRYWEIPANGCMLLSEQLPIRIPSNFVDGESAVFFRDLEELEERLDHYMAHPAEAETIARAGYDLLRRRHTATARARQLLGWAERLLSDADPA